MRWLMSNWMWLVVVIIVIWWVVTIFRWRGGRLPSFRSWFPFGSAIECRKIWNGRRLSNHSGNKCGKNLQFCYNFKLSLKVCLSLTKNLFIFLLQPSNFNWCNLDASTGFLYSLFESFNRAQTCFMFFFLMISVSIT